MLFDPFDNGRLRLQNRIVMAPMTRCRAVDANTPNALMAEYYGQRASAGLLITEGTSPSPDGLGYARIPGLFNAAQRDGWRLVTDAAHAGGAKIFIQFMHCGRVSATANLPAGARAVGPVAAVCPGEMYTDTAGMQPHALPHALAEAEIPALVAEFVAAARLAVEAGFDGIELHAANGYLLEQFLNANVNTRTDAYGGSAAARNRLVLEVARACVDAIGAERVGIRVSPYGVFNSTGAFEGVEEQYLALARDLSDIGLVYLHLVDHSAMGAPEVPADFKARLQAAFDGAFIASGGLTVATAEAALTEGRGDLAAFGRPFISNPDLVRRLQDGLPLTEPDANTFYTPGAAGYTDYPLAS
ncbi:alkene reductase [Chitinilyticum piscinae]|uniref:Alkene reductase n=1 Tax=Chitinilyticum piscinae TaxID=2866724 RepID=A0A8J7K7Z2_9NEIS|nr:alkene reductase [Chitinilyticum piscinae]MBE9608788.1 alkene reductase [Chitinilyticum piscinae]